jgi:hypothetical protein
MVWPIIDNQDEKRYVAFGSPYLKDAASASQRMAARWLRGQEHVEER